MDIIKIIPAIIITIVIKEWVGDTEAIIYLLFMMFNFMMTKLE